MSGAVIVFVGLFSMCFLKRKLGLQEWGGIFLVIGGLALVGISDFVAPASKIHNATDYYELEDVTPSNHTTNEVIIGDLLIVAAQVVAATQMVLEEKFVAGLDIPALQAVGWEGLFGFIMLGLLLIPFYFIHVPDGFSGNPRNVLEDALDAFAQMSNNPVIICAILGTVFSIAFFNFAGVSVTKEISATTRMVLDSVRTLVIWMVALSLGWQRFYWLQIVGFILLVSGMAVYNKVFTALRGSSDTHGDQETLVSHPADEPTEE